MRMQTTRLSIARLGLAAMGLALLATPLSAAAQSTTPGCPIADDATVSGAVGSPLTGSVNGTAGPVTVCTFTDGSAASRAFGVSREAGAFGPAEGGAGALAQRYIPGLPDAAKSQIDALSQVGLNVALPEYQFEAVPGLGDSALWVKAQLMPGSFKDSLLVQRGTDAFSFDVDDSPDARAALTALAQAVVAQPTQ